MEICSVRWFSNKKHQEEKSSSSVDVSWSEHEHKKFGESTVFASITLQCRSIVDVVGGKQSLE